MIKKYRVLKNDLFVPEGIEVIEVVYEETRKGYKALAEIEALALGNMYPYFLKEEFLEEIQA